MCGILGVYFTDESKKEDRLNWVKDVIGKMAHRGPDAEKVEAFDHCVLGHRRLAIIDLSDAGIQPMKSLDKRFTIVYNGEIYNYIELREELQSMGLEFTTETDTEVLLSAFSILGFQVFSKLNGQFTFLIWDNKEKTMIIARDRFGIKPLYYSQIDGDFVFSSEMRPIISLMQNKDLQPNPKVIYDYLMFSNIDHTNETFFNGIFRVPAGHYCTLSGGKPIFNRYWDLKRDISELQSSKEFKQKNLKDHIFQVKRYFTRAVELRLRSDVRVGSCLSGGIDSSSVVSIVNEIIQEKERQNFETFSLIYGDWFKLDEKRFIDIVNTKTGFQPNFITPTFEKLNNQFKDFLLYQEEPIEGFSPFGQFCVMELARNNGTTVLLDGQGADEILAGYEFYKGYFLVSLLRRFKFLKLVKEMVKARKNKSIMKIFLSHFIPSFLLRKIQQRDQKFLGFLNKEFSSNFPISESPAFQKRTRMRRGNFNVLLIDYLEESFQHLLRYEDRNSMRFSIESRVPFLDHHLVTYILALPPDFLIKDGISKWVFREAMRTITPETILQRRDKIGFASPDKQWLMEDNLVLYSDLKHPHEFLHDFVDYEAIINLYERKNLNRVTNKDLGFLFRVMCLNAWLNLYFDGG
ncbi:MAG: asparagine synthase (glutamine-hydrolyzing) [Candidatus Thorarchaeota archaeon]